MIYLDTNFFIITHFDQSEKGEKARKILQVIVNGKQAVTSTLTMDEVMWVIIKNKKGEVLRTVIENIYGTPNLTIKEVGIAIPLEALAFIEKNNLKPRDAFHAAIMKVLGVEEIVSDDSDFDRVEHIRRIKL